MRRLLLFFLLLTAGCWILFALSTLYLWSATLCLIFLVTSIVSSCVLSCAILSFVLKMLRVRLSGYLIFAIIDFLLIIATIIYSFYDIANDTGMFPGLGGKLMLVILVPCLSVIMLIDIGLWIIRRLLIRSNK